MIDGCVVGLVLDNRDPNAMHRVLVRFPVASGVESSWCRMVTPMGGRDRGLVILPDIGTEVLLMFAYRTMSPYVLGALYNGEEDTAAPYRNDDENDDRRVLWTRSGHLVDFEDTPGGERIGLGAKATTRLQVSSGPVHYDLDDAGGCLTEKSEGCAFHDARGGMLIKCKTASIEAEEILIGAGQMAALSADTVTIEAKTVRATSPDTRVKMSASAA